MKLIAKSYLLGISSDGGKTWKFIDGTGLDNKGEFARNYSRRYPQNSNFPRNKSQSSLRTNDRSTDAQLLQHPIDNFARLRKHLRQFGTVGDYDQNVVLLLMQVDKQLADALGILAIEVAGRFIGEQQRRLLDQGAGHGDALPLAAGEFGGIVSESVGSGRRVPANRGHILDSCGVAFAIHERRHQHIFQNGALRQQMMILKDEADPTIAERGQFWLGKCEGVGPFQRDGAARGLFERAENVQQGALARAGRPHHGQGVAALESAD